MKQSNSTSPSPTPSGNAASTNGEPPKMKYRCKLCGQPKQNHTCRYQQSLQRSIGIMVYPASNAYNANEPGNLAPALVEMNNFTMLELESLSTETSPSRPMLEFKRRSPPNVTPDSLCLVINQSKRESMNSRNSPRSPLSGNSTPHGTPFRRKPDGHLVVPTGAKQLRRGDYSGLNGFGYDLSADLVFLDTMEVKPEQYRNVTQSSKQTTTSKQGDYKYPALPLPYGQRKRLSDSLFSMSKEIEGLTDECAVVLREARQKGMWDLAVSELLTQVVVVLHCQDNDNTLDGLRGYLLSLGISC